MTDSAPTTTNQTATTVDTVIQDTVSAAEKLADTAAETALDTAAPLFAAPVIKQLTDAIIEGIIKVLGDQVSVQLQNVGTFIVIDTQVSGEESGLSQALQNLMIAEKSGDPNAIQAAIQAYANYNSSLIHDDGSASPSV